MYLERLLTWIIALATCAALAACSGDGVTVAPEPYSPRIHVLASKDATLAPADSGDPSAWVLTLENPEPEAMWYTDRPNQETGSTPLDTYVNTVNWQSAYGDVDPNATVVFQLTGSTALDGLYVSLSSPVYDEKAGTIRFNATMLNHTLDELKPEPIALTQVIVNVLNNVSDDKEVSSYIQYGSLAVVQPTPVSNQYKIVLSEAGPDMIWVDNAPGTYSDSRPMATFFPQWNHVFKDAPPNAALFGTTATGKLKLYFFTLTDPVYDASAKEVSYTATPLGDTSGAFETINRAVLSIDSGAFTRFPIPGKGTGYQAFGQGYDPSTANTSYIYFGSDIARKQTGSLWGTQSYLSQSCAPHCRNDLKTMQSLGINLIRLYDWDPRADHSQFLDYAASLKIKVVVPISNWLPTQNESVWNEQVPVYFNNRNFGNKNGTDWHPAVAGVIISNELDANGGQYYGNVVGLVARFLQEADARGFSKSVPVGVPVTFVPRGAPFAAGGQNMPGWNQFDRLLSDPRTAPYKNRLMLCPNTYNSKEYLFSNAEGTGEGWVPLTYKQFGVPILFTEIGLSRAQGHFTPKFVQDQLEGALEYQMNHPEQVLGAMHFQFDNKVWKQTPDDSDSEGAYGMFRHGAILKQIQTVKNDFDFYVYEANENYGVLTIDSLEATATYAPVVDAYK